jgi:hypothetical protein
MNWNTFWEVAYGSVFLISILAPALHSILMILSISKQQHNGVRRVPPSLCAIWAEDLNQAYRRPEVCIAWVYDRTTNEKEFAPMCLQIRK